MEIDRKKIPSYFMILVIIVIIVIFNISYFNSYISANHEKITDYNLSDEDINPIRETAVAGLFYPADLYQLNNDIDDYLEHVPSPLNRRPHIMIVPHAGYRYSAQVAAHAYKRLLPFKNKIKKVFLLGPSHRNFIEGVALSPAKQFRTPLGLINTDETITSELKKNPLFKVSGKTHRQEHALEVQMPFLQKTLKKFTIIPMLYGHADPQEIADAIAPYINDNKTLLIISSDLSHYLDYATAQKTDEETAKQISDFLPVDHHQSCGATAINTAMILAQKFGLVPHLLDIVNSGDVSEDKSKVVGYGSWVYDEPEEKPILSGIELEENNLKNFARHNKESLLKIVRQSLISAVKKHQLFIPEREEFSDVLFDKGVSFVTLRKKGILRGCIGSLLPNKAIASDLADNTYAAALHDTRFSPVKPNELKDIDFSISLLTNFEPIKFNSYEDLLSKIEPNIDGLFIKDGKREGLFLPMVWLEIPDRHEFITQLKIKAGLSPSYWSNNIEVFRFRTVEITDDKH